MLMADLAQIEALSALVNITNHLFDTQVIASIEKNAVLSIIKQKVLTELNRLNTL